MTFRLWSIRITSTSPIATRALSALQISLTECSQLVSSALTSRSVIPLSTGGHQMKNQFNYVDGFVIPVRRKDLSKYVKVSKFMCKVWKEHGALQYVENVADDVKRGKVTSFPRSVKAN